MSKKVSKILTLVVGVLGLIGFGLFVRILMTGDEAIKEGTAELQNSLLSPYITFAKVLLVVTALLAILASLFTIVTRPAVLKKTLISVAVLAVLLFISYSLASDAAVTNSLGEVLKDGEAGSISKWVGTGMIYSAILGGIALIGFLADFIKSLVK